MNHDTGDTMSIDQRAATTGVLQDVVADGRARTFLGILGFVLATTAGAYAAVPLPWTPVPMTLQPLFVILAGALLGPWAGATAMAAYLAVGAAGAPVFSNGHAGLPWLMGATGGYLVAYPAAAFVVGLIARPAAGKLRTLAGLVSGLALIYLGGLAQLSILTGQAPVEVLGIAVVPFLGGDAVKVLIALVVVGLVRSASDLRSLGR